MSLCFWRCLVSSGGPKFGVSPLRFKQCENRLSLRPSTSQFLGPPVSAANRDIVSAGNREPVSASNRDPVSAANRDLISAANRDRVSAANKDLVSGAHRKPWESLKKSLRKPLENFSYYLRSPGRKQEHNEIPLVPGRGGANFEEKKTYVLTPNPFWNKEPWKLSFGKKELLKLSVIEVVNHHHQ